MKNWTTVNWSKVWSFLKTVVKYSLLAIVLVFFYEQLMFMNITLMQLLEQQGLTNYFLQRNPLLGV